jgi:hypothetical protein
MTPEEAKQYFEDRLEEDLELLSPKDRVALYFGQVLEYFQPKRQRTSINDNDKELPDDIYTH